MKINELKLTLEDMEKQNEKVKEIQEKIEYAGTKREQEIAKKLEPIKKNVGTLIEGFIPSIHTSQFFFIY